MAAQAVVGVSVFPQPGVSGPCPLSPISPEAYMELSRG